VLLAAADGAAREDVQHPRRPACFHCEREPRLSSGTLRAPDS
jgi:hypothetical protein